MKAKEQLNLMDMDNRSDHMGRPPTPEIVINENREEELRKPHVILIQKISKGKAIQKLVGFVAAQLIYES